MTSGTTPADQKDINLRILRQPLEHAGGKEFDTPVSVAVIEHLMIAGVGVNGHHIWCQLHHLPITPYKMPGGQKNDNLCLQNRTKGCRFFLDVPLAWSSGQVVNIVPKVLPPKPTSWSEITKLYNSSEWIAPEDGWFKIIIAGRGGNGGRSDSRWGKSTAINMGAGGGSPGCAVSEIALQQGESVRITIDGYNCSCVIKDISMQATKGGDGKTASTTAENGGDGGKSSGGNKHNYEGIRGVKSGAQEQSRDYSYTSTVYGRKGGQLNVDGYSFYGGTGGGGTLVAVEGNSNGVRVWNREVSPSGGSAPICIILRGNTNIPLDMQNARDITANALAITALAQEQTGILLGTLA